MEETSTQSQSTQPPNECIIVKLKALMEAIDEDRSCWWDWCLGEEIKGQPGTYLTLKRVFDDKVQVVWKDRGMSAHPTIPGKRIHQLRLSTENPFRYCWIPADLDIAVCVYKYFKKHPEFLDFFHRVFTQLFDFEFFKKDFIYRNSPIISTIYFKAPHNYLMEVSWDIPRFFLHKIVDLDKDEFIVSEPYLLDKLITVWHEVLEAEEKKEKNEAERKRKKGSELVDSEPVASAEATEKRSKETQTESNSDTKLKRVPNYFLRAKGRLLKAAEHYKQAMITRADMLQEWLDAIPIETDSQERGTLPVISIVNEVNRVIQEYKDDASQNDPNCVAPFEIRTEAWNMIKKDCFKMECRQKAGQLMRMLMSMVFEGNYDNIQEAWELADALGLEDAKRIMLELKRLDRIVFPERDKDGARIEPASPSPNIPV